MPLEPTQFDVVRWRPWPCEKCGGGASPLDFLVGCPPADGTLSRGTPDEIIDEITTRERAWLWKWAVNCPHKDELSFKLARINEGSEHLVYFHDSGVDVLKLTKPGIFGDSYFLVNGRVHQRCCTPSDYFVRLILLDMHFGFAPEAIGVTEAGQIVTRQKFVKGDPPTQEEVDVFLSGSGLEPVNQRCFIWNRASPEDGFEYWVGDARDENFVKTINGIVPIDLRMWAVAIGEPE